MLTKEMKSSPRSLLLDKVDAVQSVAENGVIKKTCRFARCCSHCRTECLVVRNHWFCAAERSPDASVPAANQKVTLTKVRLRVFPLQSKAFPSP